MGWRRNYFSRRVAVVILWRGSPIGVRLTVSSSAPPQTGRIEPVRVVLQQFGDAGWIIAAKGALVDIAIISPCALILEFGIVRQPAPFTLTCITTLYNYAKL